VSAAVRSPAPADLASRLAAAAPAELRERDQWVLWRRAPRGGKETKRPVLAADPSRPASSTDPSTWASFERALEALPGLGEAGGGVGFVFSPDDPFVGVDLDDCLNEDGEIAPWAAEIVAELDSFTERSVSGRGIHIFVRGELRGDRHRTGSFEIYGVSRYFCVTGERVGTRATIEARQEQLDRVVERMLPPPTPTPAPVNGSGPQGLATPDDQELLDHAFRAKNGAKVEALFSGDTSGYSSRSEADLALASGLAFWTHRDPARLDRLFRGSGLMRPKWDSKRGESTYGAQTVERAISGRSEFFEPRSARAESRGGPENDGAGSNARARVPARASSSNDADAEPTPFTVTSDKGKVVFPALPEHHDHAGLCGWLTSVFARDPSYPITGAEWQGLRGPAGHVVLNRAGGAPPIRFEPVAHVNAPMRLVETLSWQRVPTDRPLFAFKADHCRQIAYVIGCLADATATASAEDEAAGIVSTFMLSAQEVEGFRTYGATAQRFEAAVALRRPLDEHVGRAIGPPRFLRDADTGEFVIAVSDLGEAARRHVGSTLPRGWLDARMQALGWARVEIQGYAQHGRRGRSGGHARIYAFRGHLPGGEDEGPVNT
jgi:hypothetical protein